MCNGIVEMFVTSHSLMYICLYYKTAHNLVTDHSHTHSHSCRSDKKMGGNAGIDPHSFMVSVIFGDTIQCWCILFVRRALVISMHVV